MAERFGSRLSRSLHRETLPRRPEKSCRDGGGIIICASSVRASDYIIGLICKLLRIFRWLMNTRMIQEK